MMCSVQHMGVSPISQSAPVSNGGLLPTAAEQSGGPKFVEHIVVATVLPFVEGGILEDMVKQLHEAMVLPGVLATHVGRCEPTLGKKHTFVVHIRAIDSASSDKAYGAACEVYKRHLAMHKRTLGKGYLGDALIVDFMANVVGAWDSKWPAIRIAMFQYKPEAPEELKESLLKVLARLPSLFPCVKQVSWGRNVAKVRTCGGPYGYADADLGVILGFSSPHDMYSLGDDPKYWELLNYHGMAHLVQYQALTLCPT